MFLEVDVAVPEISVWVSVRVPGWFQVHVRVQLRLLGWFSLKLDRRSLPTTFAVRDTA